MKAHPHFWLASAAMVVMALLVSTTWRHSPWLALSAPAVLVAGVAAVLAVEFLLVRCIRGAHDPAAPGPLALSRAWAAEVGQALRVFGWRLPFRRASRPDVLDAHTRGRRGVVFVHGFVCNRGFWAPWLRRLSAMGHGYVALNLAPQFTSIDDYASQIDAAVTRVADATGLPPLLICHSMGGLAARAWLRGANDPGRVHHIVTIGTPHQGAWLARFGWSRNARQMRCGSDWLQALTRAEATMTYRPPLTCWYSDADNIVFPVAHATLPWGAARLVCGRGHIALAFSDEVMAESLALLTAL